MDAIKRAGTVALRLTVLPGVSEAIVVGTVGMFVFKIPFMLSLSMGFIHPSHMHMRAKLRAVDADHAAHAHSILRQPRRCEHAQPLLPRTLLADTYVLGPCTPGARAGEGTVKPEAPRRRRESAASFLHRGDGFRRPAESTHNLQDL